MQQACFRHADPMTYRRRSGLCTTRVISARRKASFSVGTCRTVSLDVSDESRETVDRWTFSPVTSEVAGSSPVHLATKLLIIKRFW